VQCLPLSALQMHRPEGVCPEAPGALLDQHGGGPAAVPLHDPDPLRDQPLCRHQGVLIRPLLLFSSGAVLTHEAPAQGGYLGP
jgi:hypothetical protein